MKANHSPHHDFATVDHVAVRPPIDVKTAINGLRSMGIFHLADFDEMLPPIVTETDVRRVLAQSIEHAGLHLAFAAIREQPAQWVRRSVALLFDGPMTPRGLRTDGGTRAVLGTRLGAGVIGLNPLHALRNTAPYHSSPYSPYS